MVIMNYMPEMPVRDFGIFNEADQGQQVKPLPEVQWNTQVTMTRELFDLDEIHLANYKEVSASADTEDSYIILELCFSDYRLEQRPDSEAIGRRDETITFNVDFVDLEDFIAEVRL